jgi:hypothetical protein
MTEEYWTNVLVAFMLSPIWLGLTAWGLMAFSEKLHELSLMTKEEWLEGFLGLVIIFVLCLIVGALL